MTTLAQRIASQQNGRQSLGPVTPAGRLASSRNSTQHGFSGAGANLPPDLAEEHRAELNIYIARFRPRDDYEGELLRRAALGAVRARRLAEAENAHIDEQIRTATKRWDEARADEVAALAARLSDEPADALRHLERTAHGCDHLGDAWEALGRILEVNGRWTEQEARRALRLLGLDADPTPACAASLREFWVCVLVLGCTQESATDVLRPWNDPETLTRFLPDPDEARRMLTEFVRDQVAGYESLGQTLWNDFDAPARESAATLAAFDPGPKFARLHRYHNDAERLRKQSLDELVRLRREEQRTPSRAPARNEPRPAPRPARNEPEAPAEPPLLPDMSMFTKFYRDRTASPDLPVAASTPEPALCEGR